MKLFVETQLAFKVQELVEEIQDEGFDVRSWDMPSNVAEDVIQKELTLIKEGKESGWVGDWLNDIIREVKLDMEAAHSANMDDATEAVIDGLCFDYIQKELERLRDV